MAENTARSAKQLFTGDSDTSVSARDRLIDTALELFYQYGFHAVGVDQIITKAGVTKTTFYYHFPSKDDLAVAALQRRDQWEGQAFLAQLRGISKRPHEQLLAVFDVMDQWFNDPAYRGCLFINACAEFPLPHDPVHQAAAKSYENNEQFFKDTAEAAGYTQPTEIARLLTILMEGAFSRRLISNDNHAARDAKQLALMMLERQPREQ